MVVRVTADGKLVDSKPCCMCVHFMKMYGVYRVYYTDDSGNLCCEKISDIKPDHFSNGLEMVVKYNPDSFSMKLPISIETKRFLRDKYYDKFHLKK